MDISNSDMNAVRRKDPEELVPLTPAVFHIMLALADGARHGYAVMQDVGKLTAGQMSLGPGTLYRSIQRMLVDSLIEECEHLASGDERRRYYRLTRFGRMVAKAEARRLAVLVTAAQSRNLLDELPKRTKESA